jgi:hypothetical protein
MTRSRRAHWFATALALAVAAPAVAHATDEQRPQRRPNAARFGVGLGGGSIEREGYYLADVTGLVRFGNLRADLWFPARFSTNGFTFRSQDWDEARDWARLGRCIRLDLGDFVPAPDRHDPTCEEYDPTAGLHERVYFSARVSPLQNITLGHGTLVYDYRNSIDPDQPQLGAAVDFNYLDWGNVHLIMDDVTNPHLVGGRFSARPQQVLLGQNWDETPDDLELGFTVASDLQAPLHQHQAFGRPILDPSGNLQFSTTPLTAFGADLHYLYLWRNGEGNDFTRMGAFGYVDYNHFVGVEDGNALHAGASFVLEEYRGGHRGWKFRIGAEYRNVGNRYMPEYFDSNYIVQSQQFALNRETQTLLGPNAFTTTKLEYMLSRPAGRVHAFQAWMELQIPISNGEDVAPSHLPLRAFVEDAEGDANASVYFTAGPLQLDRLALIAMYSRRNFNGLEGLTSLDGALLRAMGVLYLGGSREERNSQPNVGSDLLRNASINIRYDRRFFLVPDGRYEVTNDLIVSLNLSQGL